MPSEKKEQDKWTEVVLKLLKLTQDKELEWRALPTPETVINEPEYRVNIVFETNYKDRFIRIYERLYKDPFELQSGWTSRVVLELLDDQAMVPVWTFPHTVRLRDLLSAVQYQSSRAKDFLDTVLSDDEF